MPDLRYALRSLIRAPKFTVAAGLTFALGIGVNVAAFSTVDRLLFRPLPYRDPARVLVMGDFDPATGFPAAYLPKWFVVEAARQVPAIEQVAVAGPTGAFHLAPDAGTDAPVYLTISSANTLATLGVRPILGRDFTEDDVRARRNVGLIRYEVWQHRFGGSPNAIGQRLYSIPREIEIVGVLPPDVVVPSFVGIAFASDGMALDLDTLATATEDPFDRVNPPVVRVRPGVEVETAQAEFETVLTRLQHDVAPQPGGRPWNIRLLPMRTVLFGRDRPYLQIVVAAGSLVLLMACANLASLLLARGRSRERDAAIRASLGASRVRLVAGALAESLIVCACGGAVAVGVLAWSGPALLAVLPPLFSHAAAGLADARVMGFAVLAGTASAVAAGVVPGWRAARVDVLAVLQRTASSGRRVRGAGRRILAVEAALGVMIVLAAAVSVRSFAGLARTPVHFDPANLYWIGVRIPQKDASLNFESYLQALDVIRSEAGVRTAAGGDPALPTTPVTPAAFAADFGPTCCRWRITDGLFETLGTPLVSGRPFTESEIHAGAPVAILNVSGVRLVWPDLDPAKAVGRTLHFRDDPARAVVGVVPDIRPSPDRRAEAGIYVPATSAGFRLMEFAARMEAGTRPNLPRMQTRIADRVAAPVAVFVNPASMRVDAALRDPRFRAVAFSAFALVALLLAAVGLYGVASFDAALRRYEIGVRLALGASTRQVEWLVVGDALRPIAAGIGIGLVGAYWAVGLLQSFVPGIDARAPAMFLVVVTVMGLTGLAAAWLPARRAARLDPAAVLRE